MEYKFECPHCSQHFSATHDLIGSKQQCPSCGQQFVVPTDLQPLPAPPKRWVIVERIAATAQDVCLFSV